MLELEHSITIDRPIAEVYAFVTNPDNATKWRVGLIDAKKITEGPLRSGSIIEETVNVLGRQLKAKQEIIELISNEKRSFKISLGPLPITLFERYEATPTGTKLHVSGTTELKGPQRMLSRPVLGQVKKQLVQELAAIKTLLENA